MRLQRLVVQIDITLGKPDGDNWDLVEARHDLDKVLHDVEETLAQG